MVMVWVCLVAFTTRRVKVGFRQDQVFPRGRGDRKGKEGTNGASVKGNKVEA